MKKMKLAMAAILVVVSVQASLAQASVSLGLKGGINLASISVTNPTTSVSSLTGYHAGLFMNFKFTKLAIQPEVIFSKQGASTGLGEQTLSYVNIPIMLKYYIVSGLNIQVGPQFGLLTSAALGGADVKSFYKSSDMSICFGAGFDISKFVFDARYNLGISEVNDFAGSPAAKNNVFQLSVGYKLFKFGN